MTIQCMGRWIIECSKAKKLASHFWPKITIEVSYMGYLVDRGQSQTFPWKKKKKLDNPFCQQKPLP